MIDSDEARKEIWDQLSDGEKAICAKRDKIVAAEAALIEAENALQALCIHPLHAVQVHHDSNTGNYDPSADSYWTDHKCCLCDKRWTVFH